MPRSTTSSTTKRWACARRDGAGQGEAGAGPGDLSVDGRVVLPRPGRWWCNQQPDSAAFYLRRAVKLQPDAPLADVYRWSGTRLPLQAHAVQTLRRRRPPGRRVCAGRNGWPRIRGGGEHATGRDVPANAFRPGRCHHHARLERCLDARAIGHACPRWRGAALRHRRIRASHRSPGRADRADGHPRLHGECDRGAARARSRADPEPHGPEAERAPKALAKGIAAGLLVGTATLAMAKYGRAEDPISSSIPPDGRAAFVGFSIAAGAIAGGILDRGASLPETSRRMSSRAPSTRRRSHSLEDANRKRVADYRVSLRVEQEGIR